MELFVGHLFATLIMILAVLYKYLVNKLLRKSGMSKIQEVEFPLLNHLLIENHQLCYEGYDSGSDMEQGTFEFCKLELKKGWFLALLSS